MPRPKSNISPNRKATRPSTPVHETMDTLVQGISQQPGHLRLPGQGEAQENGWSSPVEGLTKRNPAIQQLLISTDVLNNFYLEMLHITPEEIYTVLIRPADDYETSFNLWMQIRRTTGVGVTPKVHGTGLSVLGDGTVEINDVSYLWANPLEGTDAQLFERYVLINSGPTGSLLNRTKVTALDAATTPARENNGIIFIQAVNYQVTYTVTLTHDGTETIVPAFTTPAATDTPNVISTSLVAENLTTNINAINGWSATQSDYIVEVKRDDNTAFTMDMDDTRSNTLARAFTDRVTSLAELPVRAPDDYLVNVESDPSTEVDDRWLQFQTRDGSDIGEGAWAEAPAPGIQFKLNAETMPYVIRREAENEIWVGPADGTTQTDGNDSYTFPVWGERTTGNVETIPTPDIVGQTIHDHVFFRGRYVVCGGEIVQFSEIDNAYNFFQDSVLVLTDSDTFAVRCASEVSSPLRWLLPIDETLLVWSSTSQFQLRSADSEALSPSTALVVRLSNIEMNDHVRPKLAAAKVLFATDEYGFTHFREYDFFSNRQSRLGLNLGGSNDITLNLPKYIEGLVSHWDVGEAVDFAVARTPEDPGTLYVYKYQWGSAAAGLQKIQASWSKWTFGGDVQWVKFMDNDLWMVVTYTNRTELHILRSDELVSTTDPVLKLDRQLFFPECNDDPLANNNIAFTYDAAVNVTTFTLPFSPSNGGKIQAVVRFADQGENEGLFLGETTTNVLTCSVVGDWREESIAFGEPYKFKYTFNKGYVPEANQANNRRVGRLNGRTQILTWEVHHKDTGFYKVRVNRKNRTDDSVSSFRARTIGVDNNELTDEDTVTATGTFRVPVYSRNTDCSISVESDSWLPLTVSSATWEGTYSDRSKG